MNSKTPLGIRNNNPLNIRRSKTLWKGEIPPLPIEGATGVFRETTECGFDPTKGSESPFATGSAGRGSFCAFQSMEWGLRAAFCLLRTYANKYRLCCVRDIIGRWAPPTENATNSYIRHVCQLTGFGGNQRLTEKDWPKLVKAMARMECGVDLEDDIIQKGFQLYRQK